MPNNSAGLYPGLGPKMLNLQQPMFIGIIINSAAEFINKAFKPGSMVVLKLFA